MITIILKIDKSCCSKYQVRQMYKIYRVNLYNVTKFVIYYVTISEYKAKIMTYDFLIIQTTGSEAHHLQQNFSFGE